MVNNRDVGDRTRRRNGVDGRGGSLGSPNEVLVRSHPCRTVNRDVRYAVQAVLGAEAAVNRKIDDLS